MQLKRTTLVISGFVACMAACASGQTAPATTAPVAASAPATSAVDPVIEKTLKMLEARGATLKDFAAKLRYNVEHVREGTNETNMGQAAFVKDSNNTRVAILLDTLTIDKRPIVEKGLDHRFVFDGQRIIESDANKKIFRKIEIAKPGDVRNPFDLRGPLPLPIGQKVEKVLADFDVVAIKPGKLDPATSVGLKLTPKQKNAFDFTELELIIDTAPGVEIPVRLAKTGLDQNVTSIKLTEIKINSGEAGKLPIFDIKEPPKNAGWTVEVKPIEEKK